NRDWIADDSPRPARGLSRKRLAPIAAALFCLTLHPSLAAEEVDAPKDTPKGAAVTVLKAVKSCFADIVEVSGILIPKEETAVRPELSALTVAKIPARPSGEARRRI